MSNKNRKTATERRDECVSLITGIFTRTMQSFFVLEALEKEFRIFERITLNKIRDEKVTSKEVIDIIKKWFHFAIIIRDEYKLVHYGLILRPYQISDKRFLDEHFDANLRTRTESDTILGKKKLQDGEAITAVTVICSELGIRDWLLRDKYVNDTVKKVPSCKIMFDKCSLCFETMSKDFLFLTNHSMYEEILTAIQTRYGTANSGIAFNPLFKKDSLYLNNNEEKMWIKVGRPNLSSEVDANRTLNSDDYLRFVGGFTYLGYGHHGHIYNKIFPFCVTKANVEFGLFPPTAAVTSTSSSVTTSPPEVVELEVQKLAEDGEKLAEDEQTDPSFFIREDAVSSEEVNAKELEQYLVKLRMYFPMKVFVPSSKAAVKICTFSEAVFQNASRLGMSKNIKKTTTKVPFQNAPQFQQGISKYIMENYKEVNEYYEEFINLSDDKRIFTKNVTYDNIEEYVTNTILPKKSPPPDEFLVRYMATIGMVSIRVIVTDPSDHSKIQRVVLFNPFSKYSHEVNGEVIIVYRGNIQFDYVMYEIGIEKAARDVSEFDTSSMDTALPPVMDFYTEQGARVLPAQQLGSNGNGSSGGQDLLVSSSVVEAAPTAVSFHDVGELLTEENMDEDRMADLSECYGSVELSSMPVTDIILPNASEDAIEIFNKLLQAMSAKHHIPINVQKFAYYMFSSLKVQTKLVDVYKEITRNFYKDLIAEKKSTEIDWFEMFYFIKHMLLLSEFGDPNDIKVKNEIEITEKVNQLKILQENFKSNPLPETENNIKWLTVERIQLARDHLILSKQRMVDRNKKSKQLNTIIINVLIDIAPLWQELEVQLSLTEDTNLSIAASEDGSSSDAMDIVVQPNTINTSNNKGVHVLSEFLKIYKSENSNKKEIAPPKSLEEALQYNLQINIDDREYRKQSKKRKTTSSSATYHTTASSQSDICDDYTTKKSKRGKLVVNDDDPDDNDETEEEDLPPTKNSKKTTRAGLRIIADDDDDEEAAAEAKTKKSEEKAIAYRKEKEATEAQSQRHKEQTELNRLQSEAKRKARDEAIAQRKAADEKQQHDKAEQKRLKLLEITKRKVEEYEKRMEKEYDESVQYLFEEPVVKTNDTTSNSSNTSSGAAPVVDSCSSPAAIETSSAITEEVAPRSTLSDKMKDVAYAHTRLMLDSAFRGKVNGTQYVSFEFGTIPFVCAVLGRRHYNLKHLETIDSLLEKPVLKHEIMRARNHLANHKHLILKTDYTVAKVLNPDMQSNPMNEVGKYLRGTWSELVIYTDLFLPIAACWIYGLGRSEEGHEGQEEDDEFKIELLYCKKKDNDPDPVCIFKTFVDAQTDSYYQELHCPNYSIPVFGCDVDVHQPINKGFYTPNNVNGFRTNKLEF